MTSPKIAFVTGGNGITGSAIIEHLASKTDSTQFKKIITTSRSPFQLLVSDPRIEFIALDFTRSSEELTKLMTDICSEVTHAYFSSYVHKDDFVELNNANIALFQNFISALVKVAPKLENVTLQTGGKHYNVHLYPVPSPAREEEPRCGGPETNFYYSQEDALFSAQKDSKWSWNVIRPEAIIGTSPKPNGMNSALTYALYILTSKKLGVSPDMPTNSVYWDASDDSSFAPLIADFTIWASTNQACANQAFNITNGDYYCWRYMWPRVCNYFGVTSNQETHFSKPGLEVGKPFLETSFTEWATPEKQKAWEQLCEDAGCEEAKATWAAGTWQYQDWVFGRTWSATLSMSKARKFGYTGYIDSFEAFVAAYEKMKQLKQLPSW